METLETLENGNIILGNQIDQQEESETLNEIVDQIENEGEEISSDVRQELQEKVNEILETQETSLEERKKKKRGRKKKVTDFIDERYTEKTTEVTEEQQKIDTTITEVEKMAGYVVCDFFLQKVPSIITALTGGKVSFNKIEIDDNLTTLATLALREQQVKMSYTSQFILTVLVTLVSNIKLNK